MKDVRLELSADVGVYVAAAMLAEGARLAVALAAGSRGQHRVSVFDTRTWKVAATFPIPSLARSGVTPIAGEGDVLFANDDHGLVAFEARSGTRLWARSYPAPRSVRLVAVAAGKLLVSVLGPDAKSETRILRASDGADRSVVATEIEPSLVAAAFGRDGTVVVVGMRVVEVFRPGEPMRELAHEMKRWASVDVAALDADARRLVFGNRAGEVLVTDLARGVTSTVLEMESAVRSVGFLRGAPWALDDRGRLRVIGGAGRRRSVDLGVSTHGGMLSEDGKTIALGDLATRTLRVRTVPENEERFSTNPGFSCNAVGIDASGALLVSSQDVLLRIDPPGGKPVKLGEGVRDIARLASGPMVLAGRSVLRLGPKAKKATALARSFEEVAVAGDLVLTLDGLVGEIWNARTGKRQWRLDLDDTWVSDTGETLRLVHLGPDGRPWVHLTDGRVYRADAIARKSGHVGTLSAEGSLWLHPDGATLYWAREQKIQRISVDGLRKARPLPLAVKADVGRLVFAPSGQRLVVFHRDGRLSSIDLVRRTAVAIDGPRTSAAERGPGELFIVDLQTPSGCAFSLDERVIAWTDAGGVSFADAETGARRGRFLMARSGVEYVVMADGRFDWPGAKAGTAISPELVALEGDGPLTQAALRERRAPGLLGSLTGQGDDRRR